MKVYLMNKHILVKSLIIIALFIGLGSCTKKENPVPTLVGNWQWIHTSGGIAGIDKKPEAGEVRVLRIHENLTYVWLLNGIQQKAGTYQLLEHEAYLFQGKSTFIMFDKVLSQIYQLKGNKFLLIDDVNDGFIYEFVRI